MNVSVIGIGAMGRPIAQNLLKAGHGVLVYNRNAQRAEPLRSGGAVVATSIAQACDAEVVITMLPDDAAVEGLVLESNDARCHSSPNR